METMTIRRVGTVIQTGKGSFRRVKWDDYTERVQAAPEAFYKLNRGDRFEAMVTVKLPNFQYISMTDVILVGPLPTLEECQKLWDEIMGEDQPVIAVDWDEIKGE